MNSLVNNEKQSHCIYHTQHTHPSRKDGKLHLKKTQKINTLTLVANVCVKQEAKQQQNRQPELHQLTTKNYYPTTAVKRRRKQNS